jgi:hypothetical protein
MSLANRRRQPVDEQIVVAEHLHVRVLNQLPGRTGRQQRRTLGFPGVSDRVTAGNSLHIAPLGLRKKSALTKSTERNFRFST